LVEINPGEDFINGLHVSMAWHRVVFSGFVIVKDNEGWKERWWHAIGCI